MIIDPPESMRESILDIFRQYARPLGAKESLVPSTECRLTPVRAVLTDIYGTVVCSGVGDISLSEETDSDGHFFDALKEGYENWEWWIQKARATHFSPSQVFRELILDEHRRSRVEGEPYPEVNILQVWHDLLTRWNGEASGFVSEPLSLARIATAYECLSNPVWPYEGVFDALAEFRDQGIPVGIVSNSQFYTPLMIEYFGGKSLCELGIDESLCVWSYREGRGKPSSELFHSAADRLEKFYGIKASEAVFIGNDMLKDMVASHRAGFQTALFAGDARSLRLRQDDRDCCDFSPGWVFRNWREFMEQLPVESDPASRLETQHPPESGPESL